MKFLKITNQNDLQILSKFISSLKEEKETFKYFDKRKIEIVFNHELTFLLFGIKDEILAYGHIEKEDDNYWLGILVPSKHQSKGNGVLMITKLIEESKKLKIPKITLSVYKTNKKAVHLYNKMGFTVFKENESNLFFEKLI
jgi:ribosomal protein S18 acetylase RimI-like enzyme